MSTFMDMVNDFTDPREIPLDELMGWLESLYHYCIPENKEVGEHAFNVLDYQYMEEMGAFFKKQAAALETKEKWTQLAIDMISELRQDYIPGELSELDGVKAIKKLRTRIAELEVQLKEAREDERESKTKEVVEMK